MPPPYRRSLGATLAVSLALTIAFLFLPLAGTDLSAQVARGHFVQAYGLLPVDFRWYGGIFPLGYSFLTGPLNALLGARGVGAIGSVLGAGALAFVFVRTRVARPVLGGVLGAICLVFNLVSGRMTFSLGIAFGLLALCAMVLDELAPWTRTVLVAGLAALSTAASPIAGVFTGLAGAALLLAGRRRDGLALGLGAAVPLGFTWLLFRDGGVQPFDGATAKLVIALSIATAFLVPYRVLRIGALLAAVGVFAAYLFASPVGYNAARLPLLFALPVVSATAQLRRSHLIVVLVLMSWWQPPLVTSDLSSAGKRTAHRPYFQPLIDELDQRKPIGRIEVVPPHDHWESTYVADAVPIGRGWERQVDVDRNRLFYGDLYDTTLDSSSYLAWLYDNAIAYVAVPLHTRVDKWGREERALVAATLPYLTRVWSNPNWDLYRVNGAQPMVTRPGQLVSSGATGVTFDMPSGGTVVVRLRWSRWLQLSGPAGCLRSGGKWTVVKVDAPGRYRLGSGWHLRQPRHC